MIYYQENVAFRSENMLCEAVVWIVFAAIAASVFCVSMGRVDMAILVCLWAVLILSMCHVI